jgi:Clp amino terminal domain, pathogenicity island component
MNPRSRTIAVIVGTTVLAAGAGIGVAAQGDSSPATDRSEPGMMRGGGGPGSDLSSLADELGVTETRLREAMEASRQAGRGPQDMAAALADELGISEAKVRDALEAAMPQGGPPPADGQGAPSTGGQSGATTQS